MADDAELHRRNIEFIAAKFAQSAAAGRAGAHASIWQMFNICAEEMIRQSFARWIGEIFGCRSFRHWRTGARRFQFFKCQFQLLNMTADFLRRLAKSQALELGKLGAQFFNLQVARQQSGFDMDNFIITLSQKRVLVAKQRAQNSNLCVFLCNDLLRMIHAICIAESAIHAQHYQRNLANLSRQLRLCRALHASPIHTFHQHRELRCA
jgi:hypothetical protein